jgi:hypothetical protein
MSEIVDPFDQLVESCHATGWKSPRDKDEHFYSKMEELFAQIRQWMEPYVLAGKMEIESFPAAMRGVDEYYCGVVALKIIIGGDVACLIPKSPPTRRNPGVVTMEGMSSSLRLHLTTNGWRTHTSRASKDGHFRSSASFGLTKEVFKESLARIM